MPVNDELKFADVTTILVDKTSSYKKYIGFEINSSTTAADSAQARLLEFSENVERSSIQANIYELSDLKSCSKESSSQAAIEFDSSNSKQGTLEGSMYFPSLDVIDYGTALAIRGIYGLGENKKISFKTISIKSDNTAVVYYWMESNCD